jgi:hypothetical protein
MAFHIIYLYKNVFQLFANFLLVFQKMVCDLVVYFCNCWNFYLTIEQHLSIPLAIGAAIIFGICPEIVGHAD